MKEFTKYIYVYTGMKCFRNEIDINEIGVVQCSDKSTKTLATLFRITRFNIYQNHHSLPHSQYWIILLSVKQR